MEQPAARSSSQAARYRILVSCLHHENTLFAQRAGLFLVANSALLGLSVSDQISTGSSTFTRADVLLHGLAPSLAGLMICVLWFMSALSGQFFIHHWEKHIKEVEPDIFGEWQVYRHFQPDDSYPPRPAREAAVTYALIAGFAVLWICLVVYVSVCAAGVQL